MIVMILMPFVAGLLRVATWPLGEDVVGRIDHMAIDGPWLAVNALAANRTLVLNATSGTRLRVLGPLANPQGAAFAHAPASTLLIADALDGAIHLYQTGSFEERASLVLGADADNSRWDARLSRFIVGYGDKTRHGAGDDARLPRAGVAEINSTNGQVISVTELPAHAEALELSPDGERMFVNVPDADDSIALVNRTRNAVIATWQLTRPSDGARLRENFPMAQIPGRDRLLVGCRKPPTLAMIDTITGTVVSSIQSAGDADDIWVDGSVVYLTGGSGEISTFRIDGDRLLASNSTPTSSLARTSLFDPASRRLFVAVPKLKKDDAEASVWVFDVAHS